MPPSQSKDGGLLLKKGKYLLLPWDTSFTMALGTGPWPASVSWTVREWGALHLQTVGSLLACMSQNTWENTSMTETTTRNWEERILFQTRRQTGMQIKRGGEHNRNVCDHNCLCAKLGQLMCTKLSLTLSQFLRRCSFSLVGPFSLKLFYPSLYF